MAERNEPDLLREGYEYALRKNGVKPTPAMIADLALTTLYGLAAMIAKHEVAEVNKRIGKGKKGKRRKT